MPRGAPFSRGLFFLGRPLVYISPHHHYHHKPANRWNIINFNFFFFFSTIGSVLHSSAKWGTTQLFIWFKSTTSPPPLKKEIRRFVITHFLLIIIFFFHNGVKWASSLWWVMPVFYWRSSRSRPLGITRTSRRSLNDEEKSSLSSFSIHWMGICFSFKREQKLNCSLFWKTYIFFFFYYLEDKKNVFFFGCRSLVVSLFLGCWPSDGWM